MQKLSTYSFRKLVLIFVPLIFSAALTITWMSCRENSVEENKAATNDRPLLTDEEMKRAVLLDTSYLLPKEMAMKTVMSVVSQFKDGKTRTLRNLDAAPSLYSFTGKTEIKTDFAISKPETPSLYIANFNDDAGYVLISADMRAPEILGYSAAGNLDPTVHNGLKLTLVNALQHVDEKVAEAETMRYDSIFTGMVKKLENAFAKKTGKKLPLHNGKKPDAAARAMNDPEGCNPYHYSYPTLVQTGIISQTGPLLQTEWTQEAPFNEKYAGNCNNNPKWYSNPRTGEQRRFSNNHYLAGCVPIAEAQLVAYLAATNSSRLSFEGLSRQRWMDITAKSPVEYTADDIERVAGLVKKVLLSYDSKAVSLGCDATGVASGEPPKGIHLWNSSASWGNYNEGESKSSIRQSSPVLIQGCTELMCSLKPRWSSWKWWFGRREWDLVCWGSGSCHQWVLDGWRDIQTQTTYRNYWGFSGQSCSDWDWAGERSGSSTSTSTSTEITASLIHNNWGWGADSNREKESWFATGIFGNEGRNFNKTNRIVPFLK